MIDDCIIGGFALTGSFTNTFAMIPLSQTLTSKMCNHSKTKMPKKIFTAQKGTIESDQNGKNWRACAR